MKIISIRMVVGPHVGYNGYVAEHVEHIETTTDGDMPQLAWESTSDHACATTLQLVEQPRLDWGGHHLGRRCMWICVFRTTAIRIRMLRTSGDTGALCTLRNLSSSVEPICD
jgi:hypothetical protein